MSTWKEEGKRSPIESNWWADEWNDGRRNKMVGGLVDGGTEMKRTSNR